MVSSADGSPWGVVGLAGALSLCCIGIVMLVVGATITGGTAAGVTAVSGAAGGLGGILVTALATALPLFVIGLVLRWRGRQ